MKRKHIKKRKKRMLLPALLSAACIGMTAYAATCAIYTVESGDSLWKISQNYQVDLEDVISSNPHIEDPDLIYPGDTVYVPVDVVEIDNSESGTDNQATPDQSETPDSDLTETPGTGQADKTPDQSETPGQSEDPGQDEAPDTPADNADGLTDLEAQVLKLVNEERAKAGVPALTANTEVTKAARVKSKDMIDNKYFGHTSPVYGSAASMLTSYGITYRTVGENIAYGQQSAEAVMNSWMNSSGHRANILNASFTQIGIGCVSMNNGTLYWTQIFMAP